MARKEIDVIDAILAPVFAIAGAVTVGIADVSVMGYDLSTSVISTASQSISAASILAILAVAAAYVTNEPDFSRMGQTQTGVPLVPAIGDVVLGNDILGLAVLAIEAVGYYVLSWMG
jgi:cytosine/uracil/thiamine/allantoin permease